jgi:putative sterol carrier protein
MSDINALMKSMLERFNPEAARGLNASFQLTMSGEGGGVYTVVVADGKADLKTGTVPNPTVSIEISAADWAAITRGELNATNAFMTGRLRVSGDMSTAMQFTQLFRA